MTRPTPRQRAEMDQYYAELGVPMSGDHYDRDRLLAANRLRRRRNAVESTDQHEAICSIASGIREQMRADVPISDWPQAVDVLLAVSAYLAVFAAAGVDPVALVAAIAYLADDIADDTATGEGL